MHQVIAEVWIPVDRTGLCRLADHRRGASAMGSVHPNQHLVTQSSSKALYARADRTGDGQRVSLVPAPDVRWDDDGTGQWLVARRGWLEVRTETRTLPSAPSVWK